MDRPDTNRSTGAASVAELRTHPAFEVLPYDVLDRVLCAAEVFSFAKHEPLYEEGEPVEFCYVLLEGWARTLKEQPDGRAVAVDLWSRGGMPGLDDFFGAGRHALTCSGVGPGAAVRIAREAFAQTFVRSCPEFPHKIAENLAGALRRQSVVRASLALADVRTRVARLFARLLERDGAREQDASVIRVSLTRREIADLVGSTAPTVIRIIGEWTREGIVELTPQRIRIKDERRLFELVGDGNSNSLVN